MIRLEETEDEYLVAIPPDERERAKRIRPRFWDSKRLRWVYPREEKIYEALVAEFAEDAAVVDITRPGLTAKLDLKAENEALKEQLAELRQSMEVIAREDGQNKEQVAELQTMLAQREKSAAKWREEAQDMEGELDEMEGQLEKAEVRIKQLDKLLALTQSSQPFSVQLKQEALTATSGDQKFRQLLERINIDKGLPLDITRAMENEFRDLLGPDSEGASIYNLIREASEADKLPLDAIDLAHLIRKQRNLVAHQDLHQNTYLAREILCLFAAALLWPEFPE